jgi:hypothetical protein
MGGWGEGGVGREGGLRERAGGQGGHLRGHGRTKVKRRAGTVASVVAKALGGGRPWILLPREGSLSAAGGPVVRVGGPASKLAPSLHEAPRPTVPRPSTKPDTGPGPAPETASPEPKP